VITMARTATFRLLRLLLAFTACFAAVAVALAFYTRPRATHFARVVHPSFDTIAVRGVTSVYDFAATGSVFYLLDRAASRVVVLQTSDPSVIAHAFGTRGDGPGEFNGLQGLALLGDTVVVADRKGLHYFHRSGAFIRSERAPVPCISATLNPLDFHGALALAGDCVVADTLYARLYLRDGTGAFKLVASTARFTSDGRLGSHFYALRSASEADGKLLFGIGDRPCITIVAHNGPAESCARLDRYEAPPPPRIAARRRTGLAGDWPKHLPYQLDRTTVDGKPALLRPFANDSVVLQMLGTGQNILKAALTGFVACRQTGCMWAVHETEGMRLLWLPAARIDSIARARRAD
jgi:hypothetical protein